MLRNCKYYHGIFEKYVRKEGRKDERKKERKKGKKRKKRKKKGRKNDRKTVGNKETPKGTKKTSICHFTL